MKVYPYYSTFRWFKVAVEVVYKKSNPCYQANCVSIRGYLGPWMVGVNFLWN